MKDVDECDESLNGGCDHTCTNTNGSYYCTCDENYILDDDGRNCTKHTVCDDILCIAWDNPLKAVIIIVLAGEYTASGYDFMKLFILHLYVHSCFDSFIDASSL